jgi:hypothetical protein
MIGKVIDIRSPGNDAVKNSPSTRVMSINPLNSLGWDHDNVLGSLRLQMQDNEHGYYKKVIRQKSRIII